jgi:dipeptidyl aminopeptidase/acylaminoacyl peptidase
MRALPLAIAAALTLTAPAQASIVYARGTAHRSVWIANDDGSGARKLVSEGDAPRISPDGQTVVYTANESGSRPQLREVPAAGGASKLLLVPVRYGTFAWSSDGRYVAAQTGPLDGAQKLVLIDRATGTSRTLASGAFYGASFSPDASQLVYSRARHDALFPVANLAVAPTAGGAAHAITSDGRDQYPLWGPSRIVYDRYRHPARHGDGPKLDLWLGAPDGSGRRRLTHTKVPFLQSGLIATAWSADGTRLLTQFGGQDITYPVTVNPTTGAERVLGSKSEGFFASALSRDGSTVLGMLGGPVFGTRARVVTVPYDGGRATTLAPGDSADWNR